MMGFTRNDVIQQPNQNRLIQFGQNDTKTCFDVGDIINAEWENAIRNGWDKPVANRGGDYVTRDFVCAAAAYYYQNKSKRTMRYYADVALFFDASIRSEYDMLAFSHFAKARKYDDWREYLEYAASGGKDSGIVSVEGCEMEWEKRLQEGIDDDPVPPPPDENPFSFRSICKRAIGLLDRFDDPRIRQAVELINSAIEENEIVVK